MANSATKKFAVIGYLLTHPNSNGAMISKGLGSWSAPIYVTLYWLEKNDVIQSEWAEGPYPRRRLYRLREHAGAGQQ